MAGRAFLTAACLTKTPPLTKALPLSIHQVHKEPRSLLSVFWLSAPLLDPSAQLPPLLLSRAHSCSSHPPSEGPCPVPCPTHHHLLLSLYLHPTPTLSIPVCFSFQLLTYPPGPTNGSFEPLSPSFKKQKGREAKTQSLETKWLNRRFQIQLPELLLVNCTTVGELVHFSEPSLKWAYPLALESCCAY